MTTKIPESSVLRNIILIFIFVLIASIIINWCRSDQCEEDKRITEFREERSQLQAEEEK